MTATYSGDPSASDVDWIRDKCGDVDPDAFLLQDEEISSEILDQSNLYVAAAYCCEKIVTRVGEYTQLAMLYQKRADALLATSKRKRFSSITATVGQVKDVATYPERFVHGEEQPITWDING